MLAACPEPLILTAELDPASAARFERERQSYFPSAINHIPAHVTLFHHLPGEHSAALDALLTEECRKRPACRFAATGVRFLGRGNAYALDMPGVAMLRATLGAAWRDWLTPQDRQGWQPHVTIQNKVTAAEAKALRDRLQTGFLPQDGMVIGLHLWRYLGGPWASLSRYSFGMAAAVTET